MENLKKPESLVPQKTLETLARNFCREAKSYGFGQVDYLRYVNYLLGFADESGGSQNSDEESDSTILSKNAEPVSMPAEGSRFALRTFDPDRHTEGFREWLEDPYGRYFLLSRTSGRRTDIDAFLSNPTHHIGVIELGDANPVGAVVYLNHDTTRKKAELRKIIGDPAQRGTGLAREATELWIRYGLTTLGLKKIYVNTLHTNFRNIKLNESLGFKVEGLLHNEALIDGKYHDVLRMGLWYDDGSG